MDKKVVIVGAGLAGAEAAYQVAKRGINVKLYEMRPSKKAIAHHTDLFAELVCSNSLKSKAIDNAAGLLKKEMTSLDSLIMKMAYECEVPAGQALAVDREAFAKKITDVLKKNEFVEIIHEEFKEINLNDVTIIASGPLTSDDLSNSIKKILGEDYFYFYDAASPLVYKETIGNVAYKKSRYNKGGDDYINLPFTREQFFAFYNELIVAEKVELKKFEKMINFEACLPIEEIARRGYKTLLFGPLKPVGLEMGNGNKPFAVAQLRQDNQSDTLYNIVGFQTNLTFKEQKRIFSMIPGLDSAKFARYGVMHRNTFINSPKCLYSSLITKKNQNLLFAGQITGVEGYIESAATGIIAAINAVKIIEGKKIVKLPKTTMIGALLDYLENGNPYNFQPMNANYGVLASPIKDKQEIANIALNAIKKWSEENA
ncbi:MAG: methylenetetrahydrofolate--tRNA-(uracil(54)-C(5))-methyltransferase (FADH(2)-oxidizing) TrmFO [Bacilli bacterium]|nr:methylenetetrahydrofolate--tRNA-(uracil(54)-C(5))-methyltransferase (FADH(2)-oxidizing) TrmFO [Bacilli bacterium]